MGLELDPVKVDDQEWEGYRKYAALYKQWRELIHHGVYWRMDMSDNTTLAHGVVSEDKSQALYLVSQLAMPDYSLTSPLHFAGLEAGARYQITLLDPSTFQLMGKADTRCINCQSG